MIPFLDLKAQFSSLREEMLAAVERTLDSTQFVLGQEVAEFEEEFAAFSSTKFGVAVNSGTSALHLALLAAGAGPGKEVVTVPSTFVATVAAIEYSGATPVLVDVDPQTLNMDPAKLKAAISERTVAVVPVHLHGQPADMRPILEIAREHGLKVVEDAAQAHGAEYDSKRAGSMGDMGCFSFYPGKNLGACGEGGLVTTDDEQYANLMRSLRDWGQEKKYHHVHKGFNYRMDGIQGAMLRVKMARLEEWTEARRAHAVRYRELLGGMSIDLPLELPNTRHVYHVFAIRTAERDAMKQCLDERGVGTNIHYPIPVHLQKAYANLGYKAGDFPVTEAAASSLLSLPMFAELTDEQIVQVCEAVRESLIETFGSETAQSR